MTPDPYFFLVIFCGVALVFPVAPLALAWLWRRFFQPPKPGAAKNATYECGIESQGEAQIQFQSQFIFTASFSSSSTLNRFSWCLLPLPLPGCPSARSSRS